MWRGLSTRHVRKGLDGEVSLETLRALWLPISPQVHLDTLRTRDVKTLLVYARYDLTFPVDLSRNLVNEFRERGIPHQVSVLPCGHYSTGVAPFKFMDGAVLTQVPARARSDQRYLEDVLQGGVEHAGQLLDQRRHLARVDALGDGHRVGDQQPDRRPGKQRRQDRDGPEQADAPASQLHDG